MKRTFRYRIYPTKRQAAALDEQLASACDIYNAALEQRREWWKRGRTTGFYEQCRHLTDARSAGLCAEGMNAASGEDALRRLDRAFAAFYRRVQRGERPGFPRFRSVVRYDSLTWRTGKAGGWSVTGGRLRLQGVGHIKVRWHRQFPEGANVRTVAVRRAQGKWYVSFALDGVAPKPLPPTGEAVGIDLGITTFAALSTGELVEGPRAYRSAQAQLRRAQRKWSRRSRGSHRREKARRELARVHERIREIRRDHRHKTARMLVERYDLIAVEDLNVAGLARGWLSKDVYDQGWGEFVACLTSKAEEAAKQVVLVDPRYTSQGCSSCGQIAPKALSERTHRCYCGLVLDRDTNAARNILALGAGRVPQSLTGTVSV